MALKIWPSWPGWNPPGMAADVFMASRAIVKRVWQDKHCSKTRPTSCQFQWQLFWCQRVASQKKYPSPMIFHWNGWSYSTISGYPRTIKDRLVQFIGPQHQKSSNSSVENMAPLADGPSDCRFAATSGVSKAFDRPPRKAMGSVFDGFCGIWAMVNTHYKDPMVIINP